MNQEKNWHKFPVLFSLYIAQSIPMSFFSTVVPVIMRQENYSLGSIGLLQLTKLPWILKFLWAPVIDNKTKTTRQLRSWIIVSELFYAMVILSIGLFHLQTDFKLIVLLMVVAFLVSATQDIAVDIFAILSLKPAERGIGNSMQSAGSFMGTFIGTGVLLIAYHYFGWTNLMFLLAVFVAFALVPLMLYRKTIPEERAKKPTVTLKDIYSFLFEKGKHKHILILLFYYAGTIGILTMLKPYLVDLHYSIKEIALMSGLFGTSVAAVSAFCGGFVIRKIGRINSMYLFLSLSLVAATFFWVISHAVPSTIILYIAIALLWASYGFSTVAVYTICMDRVRVGSEGTDFTIQIILIHLSSLIIAVISGKIGDLIGYTGLFGLEALVCLFTFVILFYGLPQYKEHGNPERIVG